MKRKKLNNKGFTLIELLVAMSILSIITAMAIPLLRNLTTTVTNRKFETYKDSVLYASKLYVDSYSEDLFDNRESGCAYIDLSSLIERNLAKDIEIDNMSCNNTKTYIQVIKAGGEYTFTPYITCGSTNENGITNNDGYNYPEGVHEKDETACGFESNFSMHMQPSKTENTNSTQKEELTVDITSYTGINQNVEIYYAFSRTPDKENLITEWRKLTFKVPGVEKQKNKILNGETISVSSNTFVTPDNLDENIYLITRVENLVDLYGEKWIKVGDKFTAFGPYRIDNSVPTISFLEIYRENGHWYKNISVSDGSNYERYLRLCPASNLLTTCKTSAHFNIDVAAPIEIDDYVYSHSGSSDMYKIFCTKVSDYAGNISEQACSDKAIYKVRMYQNDGTENFKYATLEYTASGQRIQNQSILNTDPDPRPGYTFLNWSKKPKKDEKVSALGLYDASYGELYAMWKPIQYTVTLRNVDAWGATETKTITFDETMTLPNYPETNGHIFEGWVPSGPAGGTARKNYKINQGTTTDLDFTAAWSAKEYTVTLTNLGGPNKTFTYYPATPRGVPIENPTRTGYTFLGWTGEEYNEPTKDVVIPWKAWGDKSYKANWKKN